jgi:hypothetical protein
VLDEAAEWAGSPTLAQQLGITAVRGAGAGSYDSAFVGLLLTNRISFELHNEQFESLGRIAICISQSIDGQSSLSCILNQRSAPTFTL